MSVQGKTIVITGVSSGIGSDTHASRSGHSRSACTGEHRFGDD